MKIFLIGANGQLGADLQTVLRREGVELTAVTRPTFDVCDFGQVAERIEALQPDVVINTSAYHKVEECEVQEARSFEVNALAVRNLAQACRKNGAVLVHCSTDYVFDGKKGSPYSETDLPRPLSVYGASKLAGEHLVALTTERHFVIRTCGLYGVVGSAGKGGNFVETMLKKASEGAALRVVHDQVLTPTFTVDLAEAIYRLIQTDRFGLYHLTSEGECSWHDFAKKIFELQRLQVNLSAVRTDEFPSPVSRPAYSVLSKGKYNSLGLPAMPRWDDAVGRYLRARLAKRTATVAASAV
jgi:dTDP-4-dehydrorhamnose reductase